MNAPDAAPSCHEFVAGLADAGVTVAFISPGSRNTPLTLAVAASDAIDDHSVRDERSAGFMAVGYAKATGRPALVVCTSGSAATHYYPAVVEADQSCVPLVVLTADRPTELRGTFAPQTMDQHGLYGNHVKASIELDVYGDGQRETGIATVSTAVQGIPGPVHVNVPVAEPLTPDRLDSAPVVERTELGSHHDPISVDHLIAGRRVLVTTGGFLGVGFPSRLAAFVDAIGAPLFADAQCRPDCSSTISSADLLVKAGELDRNPPDLVLRFGGLPTSKPLWEWLASCGVPQVLVHRSRLTDPLGSVTEFVPDPDAVVSRVPAISADRDYLDAWKAADAVATKAIDDALGASGLSEPVIARLVAEHAPAGSVLFVGSSMPIRDIDSFARPRNDLAIIANRGVNGIDGTISSALGIAAAGTPTTVLLGDVAALHDVSALAEVASFGAPLRVIVVNNDGGGIFSFLPQKQTSVIPDELFEKHWGTPHGLSVSRIGEAMGLRGLTVSGIDEFSHALTRPVAAELIEIHTDRDANVGHHRSVTDAVAGSLADAHASWSTDQ